jgi:hypothetical protein
MRITFDVPRLGRCSDLLRTPLVTGVALAYAQEAVSPVKCHQIPYSTCFLVLNTRRGCTQKQMMGRPLFMGSRMGHCRATGIMVVIAYSWLLAIKEAGTGAGRVVMSGGGAAAAEDKENTLLNTTRMEALMGLAAGMSFARDWKGSVEWHLDNEGARRNYRKMRHWTAYDWCKGRGGRDVFGYMEQLRRATWQLTGKCCMSMGTWKSGRRTGRRGRSRKLEMTSRT